MCCGVARLEYTGFSKNSECGRKHPLNYAHVMASDPELFEAIENEVTRQKEHIELIASENFVTPAVMEAMGSPLTNK